MLLIFEGSTPVDAWTWVTNMVTPYLNLGDKLSNHLNEAVKQKGDLRDQVRLKATLERKQTKAQ